MKASADTLEYNFPLIETERLALRLFDERDLDAAFRLFNDEMVQKYLAPENRRTREQMRNTLQNLRRRWFERNFGVWRVGDKSGDAMLGYCGFQPFENTGEVEILFAYFEEFWDRGIAAEAANACLRFGFEELSFARIYAATNPHNAGSRRVLEKIGMTFEEETTKRYGYEAAAYSIDAHDFTPSADFYKFKYQTVI